MEKYHTSQKKEGPESGKKINRAAKKVTAFLKDLILLRYKTLQDFASKIDMTPTQLTQFLKSNNAESYTILRCCRGLKIDPGVFYFMALYGHFDFTEESDVGWEWERRICCTVNKKKTRKGRKPKRKKLRKAA